jgi:hypothetical protein
MTPRLPVPAGVVGRAAILPALLAALLLGAAAAQAKAPPSCTRGGATLQDASGKVRVVRRELKTESAQETRREGVSACWAPTGKRFRIATERDFGDDLRSSTRVEIVDERYVGVVLTGEGGVSIGVTASVFDARKAKRVHRSARCDADDDDFRGPDDVVFLPKGGMAFACGPLWLFSNAAQSSPAMLEPAGSGARSLGLASGSDSFIDRLYWTLGDGTLKSLDLS